jgi:hypothetical protein
MLGLRMLANVHMSNHVDPCLSVSTACWEVLQFLLNVPKAGEESITDFLVWRMRALDQRFRCVRVVQSTRMREHYVTGADLELDVWLVGTNFAISLAVQSKKLGGSTDRYVSKFSYGSPRNQQIRTLIDFATRERKVPVYFLYSAEHEDTEVDCIGPLGVPSGVFVAPAGEIWKVATGVHGRQVSRGKVLSVAMTLSRLFCPGAREEIAETLGRVLARLSAGELPLSSIELPVHVESLLEAGPTGAGSSLPVIESGAFPEGGVPRFLAVYDFREYRSR